MNSVILIGRIAKDPEVRYGAQSGKAVARFSLALNRGKKNGEDLGADFPNIICFDKLAELVEKYAYKGQQIGVYGNIRTGSYEKDGKKIYTTEVQAQRVEFLSWREQDGGTQSDSAAPVIPEGFSALTDDDIPF